MRIRQLLALLSFGTTVLLQAQSELTTHALGTQGHHHEHPPSELGVANSGVAFSGETGLNYGLHFHYLRKFRGSEFRWGAGYERIFDGHKHNTVGVIAGYGLAHGWTVLISPGVTFEDEDPAALLPALHVETTYEVDIGNWHIGPVAEWAWDPEDMHVSLGIHLGIGLGGGED